MGPLDRAAVLAVDSTGQVADILALPDHLLDALWRVEAATLQPADTPRRARDRRHGRLRRRRRARPRGAAAAARGGRSSSRAGSELPAWTGPETLVLCSSYSGNTEETLAAYDAAGAAGAPRVVSASGGELPARARRDKVPVIPLPGGFQPRAAVGYSFVVALEVAAVAGARRRCARSVEAAAPLARELAAEWGPEGDEDGDAKRLARRAPRDGPGDLRAGLGAAAAYRWKCQLNENAKVPAFAAELPEAGHNEIVGWAGGGGVRAVLRGLPRGPRARASGWRRGSS